MTICEGKHFFTSERTVLEGLATDASKSLTVDPSTLLHAAERVQLRSDPYGTRTRVAGVKGRSPRPLDEGAVLEDYRGNVQVYSAMRQVQTK